MDSGDSKENESQVRRRSNRLSSPTVFSLADPKHKPLLGRKRKTNKDDDAPLRAVNGPSKEANSLAEEEDDEPAVKNQKLQKGADMAANGNDRGDGDQTDVEMDDSVDQDTDMDSEEEAEEDHELVKFKSRRDFKLSADVQEENLEPGMSLRSRRSIHETEDTEPTKHHYSLKTTFIKPSSLGSVPVQLKPLENLKGLSRRSFLKDQDHTKEKTRASTKPLNDYTSRPPLFYRPAEADRNLIVTNNFPIRKQVPQHKSTEFKNVKKPLTLRATPTSTSKGCTWYVWKLWALILLFLALGLCAYQKFSMLKTDVVQPNIQENFNADMAALQLLYPSQRSVFWKRSIRHLQRHLQTVNPTEPVSLILTGGLKAERTLACLARSLASAYSVSLNNGSILEIDGTTKTAQDSDQVKLDIDTALRKAFDGNKSAAVVHRFEELPPGSTLIFYRYCDHENAAYKKVFLVFTVMLSVDKIETDSSLSAVEDMVHDQIKEKFITSNKSTMFNQMDVDKLSGLWSRISHLILPVAAEEKTEQEGCGS